MQKGKKTRFYLLPNFITTLGLLSGFYAIIAAGNGSFKKSAVAIVIAGIFDCLDGRLARLTGTTSSFGKEYDSLCDLISFGMAPAMLAYELALHDFGRYGWLAAFLFVATCALRLARFNCQQNTCKTFLGLPCPAAAISLASMVLFFRYLHIEGAMRDSVIMGTTYFLAYLMVSTFAYPSFKKIETRGLRRFHTLVGMVLFIVVIASEPQVTFFLAWFIYLLSGPLLAIKRAWLRSMARREKLQSVER